MALALFAFSLTTLYPVHYLYYDVLLLLACAALADTLAVMPMRRLVAGWIGSAAAIALALGVVLRASVAPFPRIAIGDPVSPRALRAGFGSIEHDGRRGFAWAIGGEARLAVPRSSDAPADIVIAGESPFGEGQAPQRVTAILNGTVLGDTAIAPGHRDIRIRVATSAWWIGFNDLQLTFASTQAPHDAGGSADTRPLALAIDRIDVVPR
jgi:hypothetical protein